MVPLVVVMTERRMTDPALTTGDIAGWMGVTTEYVRGEIVNGAMPFENVARGQRRKDYRVRFSDFVTYLVARGYKRLPTPADFN